MTYTDLKSYINDAYARFVEDHIERQTIGADAKYSNTRLFFVKCIYKMLMNQNGDVDEDQFTQIEIQDAIALFNKYSNSTIIVEYE